MIQDLRIDVHMLCCGDDRSEMELVFGGWVLMLCFAVAGRLHDVVFI